MLLGVRTMNLLTRRSRGRTPTPAAWAEYSLGLIFLEVRAIGLEVEQDLGVDPLDLAVAVVPSGGS